MKMKELSKQYALLLKEAEITNSRSDALHLIHRADRLREEMSRTGVEYPCLYGS